MLNYCIDIDKKWILMLAITSLAFVAPTSSNYYSVRDWEGDNVTASCNTTESPDFDVYWTYGNSSDVVQSGVILEFIDISRNASGRYWCHSTNKTDTEDTEIVTIVDIDVTYPAEITKFSVTPATASENDTLEITCHVDGNPSPSLEIRHNVTREWLYGSSEAGSANINVTAECRYNGAFVCTGWNTMNANSSPARQERAVHVLCAPESSRSHDLLQFAQLGSTKTFFEFVYGFPAPNFTWSREDGAPMGNVTEERNVYINYGMLTISNIQISDFGNYTLEVNNSLGSYITTFRLMPDPYQAPQAPTNLTFSDVTNTSVLLSWTSGFDMWREMSFILMRRRTFTDDWYEFKELHAINGYENHGVGQNWNSNLTGLLAGVYTLRMGAFTDARWRRSNYSNIITFNITGQTPVTPSPTPWPIDNFDIPHRHSPWLIVAYSFIGVGVAALLLAIAIVLARRQMGYNVRIV